jgi:hypothetical protein
MKQTAVEWLINQVNTAKWKFADKTHREAIIKQAEEMEKEQIYRACAYYFLEDGKLTPSQYYNETFKSE